MPIKCSNKMPWIWSGPAASERLLCRCRKRHLGQWCRLWEEISGEVFERLEAAMPGWICHSSSGGCLSVYVMSYHGFLWQSFWCLVKNSQHQDQHRVSTVIYICFLLIISFYLHIIFSLFFSQKIYIYSNCSTIYYINFCRI